MTEENDLLHVRQCLEGNTKAFESIIDKYQRIIFNVTLRMVSHYEDAEDITQSVFVKAFEKLETFDANYKFFSWLYRIAVNESLNFLKQRKQFVELDESLLSKEKTPEEKYADDQISDHIQNALMELKPQYRTVVILKHFQDLSYQEISRILEVPEKTVKSRLFTARQLMKNILLKKGIRRND